MMDVNFKRSLQCRSFETGKAVNFNSHPEKEMYTLCKLKENKTKR